MKKLKDVVGRNKSKIVQMSEYRDDIFSELNHETLNRGDGLKEVSSG